MLRWRRLRATEIARTERGFTLIELLVVVIIIGILAAIAIPTMMELTDQAREKAAISDLRNGGTSAQACAAANANTGSYVGCDDANLTANFGWRKTEAVTSEVTVATNNRWVATASHDVDSDSTVFTFDTDQPFDP